jgi:signal peptidase I
MFGFGKKDKEKAEAPKKSAMREWWDSVLFAVVAATLIRGLFLEAYTIPTGSMERSLMINDFLFVSKVHYGARTPKTILQVPLTHQKIWFTEIPSYLEWIALPNYRLPGFTSVKNNDVVVFNYPGAAPEKPDPNGGYGGYEKYPVDLRTNYIKRCIGIAGDVVESKNTEIFVNGKSVPNPPNSQKWYKIECNTNPNPIMFKKLGVTVRGEGTEGGKYYYDITSTETSLSELRKYDFVTNVYPDIIPDNDRNTPYRSFPYSDSTIFNNRDNFGPITIPKKGVKIQLDAKNIALYKNVITFFDHNEKAEYKDGKILIDGKVITEYTFNQDYFFMMGDNRYESDDSRYWGFVPADHVVGKAVFIWMSIDTDGNFLNKIRWNRLFSLIK